MSHCRKNSPSGNFNCTISFTEYIVGENKFFPQNNNNRAERDMVQAEFEEEKDEVERPNWFEKAVVSIGLVWIYREISQNISSLNRADIICNHFWKHLRSEITSKNLLILK